MSPDGKARGFTRSAVPDDVKVILVKSVCDYCGFTIIGSVTEGLVEQEQEHANGCKKKRSVLS
jgi:hypothetical protein